MFDRNFHFVSRTERELRTVRTRTSLFGERGPCRCLEGSGAFGEDTPSERMRHLSSCPKLTTLISPGDSLFLFQRFGCARFVATVTCRRRAGVFNEGRAASLENQVPGSCNRFQAWSCDSLRHRTTWKKNSRASSRQGLWHGGGQHVALPATSRTSDQRRCADVNTGCGPALQQRLHACPAWMIQFFF